MESGLRCACSASTVAVSPCLPLPRRWRQVPEGFWTESAPSGGDAVPAAAVLEAEEAEAAEAAGEAEDELPATLAPEPPESDGDHLSGPRFRGAPLAEVQIQTDVKVPSSVSEGAPAQQLPTSTFAAMPPLAVVRAGRRGSLAGDSSSCIRSCRGALPGTQIVPQVSLAALSMGAAIMIIWHRRSSNPAKDQ